MRLVGGPVASLNGIGFKRKGDNAQRRGNNLLGGEIGGRSRRTGRKGKEKKNNPAHLAKTTTRIRKRMRGGVQEESEKIRLRHKTTQIIKKLRRTRTGKKTQQEGRGKRLRVYRRKHFLDEDEKGEG